jgi:SAM-dependent methyltransferase
MKRIGVILSHWAPPRRRHPYVTAGGGFSTVMEENAEVRDRAVSFGDVAELYDAYRPAPPPEAAEWLLPSGVQRVADVCAGTGTFSRVLASRASHVVAVDLDLRMLAVLRTRSPKPAAVGANGEVLPFRGGSLDAVLVSSGWHWLDPNRAVPEIARVLRPGGVLGVVWNGPNRGVDWVQELLPRRAGRATASGRPRRELSIPPGQPFSRPEHRVIDWSLPRTRAQIVGLAGTYSRVITADQRAPLAAPRAPAQGVDLPMSARCWRAIRLPA